MAEQLGSAELQLDTDNVPLERGLAEAEARVAKSVAVMQAMLDGLHGDVEVRVNALEGLAARAATASTISGPGAAAAAPAAHGGTRNEIWGVRGPERAGSVTNPIVMVVEAAKYTPMGSFAAAMGESNVQDVQRGDQSSGVASAAQLAALTAAVQDLASNANPGSKLASAGAAGMGEPQSAERVIAHLDAADSVPLKNMAAAMARIEERTRPAPPGRPTTRILSQEERDSVFLGSGRFQDFNKALDQLSRLELNKLAAGRGVDTPESLATKADVAEAIKGLGDRSTPKVPQEPVIVRSSAGEPVFVRMVDAGSRTSGLPVVLSSGGSGGGGLVPVVLPPGPAGGGGGGGQVPPIALGGQGGGGGGGGGGGHRGPWWVPRLPQASGPLATLGVGTGALGFAGLGTAASFAGLGLEHTLFTLLGIAGSAGAAVGGAGLLGLGALGTAGVGAGSDIGVLKSTVADTQTLASAITAVSQAQTAAAPSQAQFAKEVKVISDPAVTKDYNAVVDAIKRYGINSTQAATAQTNLAAAVKGVGNPQLTAAFSKWNTSLSGVSSSTASLNAQMQSLGNTAGVLAEVKLAKAGQALDTFFDLKTSAARVQAVNILMQAVHAGYTFVPLIAQSALRNLTIINGALKPLFSWLEGPQGIQIWNDLENHFAQELPIAMHAFTQGVELVLRVMDIASKYTGGFVGSLDRLFTRLNSLDNATIGAEVGKLIDDFRLWERFVKLLGTDIYLLFHQDVGTGNSIIQTLNGMLEGAQRYERSTRGQAELMNIFMVHKTEVLELLQILPKLADTFGRVYMALAPPLVSVMNTVVLPVLNLIATVISGIAHASNAAALAIGSLIVASKAFGASTVFSVLGRLVGIGGIGAAAEGAAAGGAAVAASRIPTSAAPLLEAGAGGMALEGAGAAATIAAAASAALPFLLAGGAAVVAAAAFQHFVGAPNGTVTATPGHLSGLPTPKLGASGEPGSGRFGPVGPPPPSTSNPLAGTDLNIRDVGRFANYSATQLAALITEMKEADGVKLNGVATSKNQLIALAEAALKVKNAWNQAFNQAWEAVNRFFRNTSRTLPALKDDFDSNMRLIAHSMGLNSHQGRKLVAENVQKMVMALQRGMADGKVSVSGGMRELNSVLGRGMSDNAITFTTQWKDMFSTVDGLWKDHKVTTAQFLEQVGQISKSGAANIRTTTEASYQKMFSNLKTQYDDGVITKEQFDSKVHKAQLSANSTQRTDMAAFAGNVLNAMIAAGAASSKGTDAIIKPLNDALKALGAKPISAVQVSASAIAQTVTQSVQGVAGNLFGQHATGAKVTTPMYMVGEEAPTHPEYVLATNPAYRNRNLGLWAQAGRELGVPGFAQGGRLSYGQLEGLWNKAGGPPSAAAIAAAIALAESGGADVMQQGQPFAETGWGYWQITPGGPQYLDPMTNARAAVGKYHGAGDTFSPWTTFVDGAYRAFLKGGVPPSMAAGLAMSIGTPKVSGGGALGTMIHAGLGKVSGAANKFLSNATPAGIFGGAGGGGPTGGGFSPGQLGSFDGVQVAKWIIPELLYARAHGWSGPITSGFRPGFDPHAPSGSEHALDVYPGGAVDFGGMVDPAGAANRAAFMAAAAGYPGAEKLIPATGFRDDGHMSGTGHKTGARIPAFAGGGIFGADRVPANYPRHGKPAPKGTTQSSHWKPVASFGSTAPDMQTIAKMIGQVGHLLNHDVPFLSGEYNYLQGVNSTDFSSAQFIVTQDALGNAVTPYIDWPTVNADLAQLNQLYGIESTILADYNGPKGVMSLLGPLVKGIKAAIKVRKTKIAALTKRVRENLKKIADLQAKIKTWQANISGAKTSHHIAGHYVGSGKNRKYIPAHDITDAAAVTAVKGWKGQISGANKEIAGLQVDNQSLAGTFQYAGNLTLTTGGQIGTLNKQVGSLQTDLTNMQAYLPGGGNELQGLFAMDPGAPVGAAENTLSQLSTQISALSGTTLGQQLAQAQNQAGGGAGTGGADQSQLVSLLEQQLQTANTTNFVLSQQYGVLANLPPFGGSFAAGGIVPGPPGAARTIIAHGGEEFLGIGQRSSPELHIHGLGDFVDRVEQVVDGKKQEISSYVNHDLASGARARRLLPGRTSPLVTR